MDTISSLSGFLSKILRRMNSEVANCDDLALLVALYLRAVSFLVWPFLKRLEDRFDATLWR
jgi:hypothetical protein